MPNFRSWDHHEGITHADGLMTENLALIRKLWSVAKDWGGGVWMRELTLKWLNVWARRCRTCNATKMSMPPYDKVFHCAQHESCMQITAVLLLVSWRCSLFTWGRQNLTCSLRTSRRSKYFRTCRTINTRGEKYKTKSWPGPDVGLAATLLVE